MSTNAFDTHTTVVPQDTQKEKKRKMWRNLFILNLCISLHINLSRQSGFLSQNNQRPAVAFPGHNKNHTDHGRIFFHTDFR